MATTKRRINISLPDSVDAALTLLAERDNVPEATKATDLLQLGLEIEEDQVWDAIAAKRDTKKARFVAHTKAWA
ncbi:MAG: hypothetical protein AAB490_00840 [Patescibacteria group bacterium]